MRTYKRSQLLLQQDKSLWPKENRINLKERKNSRPNSLSKNIKINKNKKWVNSLRRKPEEEIKISKIEEKDRNRIIDPVKSTKGQDNILTLDPGDSHWMIPTPHHQSRDNKVPPGFWITLISPIDMRTEDHPMRGGIKANLGSQGKAETIISKEDKKRIKVTRIKSWQGPSSYIMNEKIMEGL